MWLRQTREPSGVVYHSSNASSFCLVNQTVFFQIAHARFRNTDWLATYSVLYLRKLKASSSVCVCVTALHSCYPNRVPVICLEQQLAHQSLRHDCMYTHTLTQLDISDQWTVYISLKIVSRLSRAMRVWFQYFYPVPVQ